MVSGTAACTGTAVQQLVFENNIQNKVQQFVVISESVVVLNEVVIFVVVRRALFESDTVRLKMPSRVEWLT